MSRENPLHRARLARGIDLAEVARRTCLSPHVVQKIDAGRFDELPRGVYARSYVRAFATAVDLDPAAVIAVVGDSLPPAEDPLPELRHVAERSTPAWVRRVEAWTTAARGAMSRVIAVDRLREGQTAHAKGGEEQAHDAPVQAAARWAPAAAARSMRRTAEAAAAIRDWARRTHHLLTAHGGAARDLRLGTAARRAGAIAVDVLALAAAYALLVWLTALTTGAQPALVLQSAGLGVTIVWAMLVLQYFVLLGGVGGRTPGAWAFGVRRQIRAAPAAPLGLRAILGRTMLY